MQNYITSVAQDIISKNNTTTANITIILPSIRAGVFVKDAFKNNSNSFSFLPQIISIEEFIQNLSKIQKIDNIAILFEFYKVYLKNTPKNKIEDFDKFSNWASILIQDFNEIDRFLIDPEYIFSYINDINRIEKWFKDENTPTKLTQNYLAFFDYVAIYYKKLYQHFLTLKKGYQGLQYREAEKNIDHFIKNNSSKIIFVGFNALNKAEENIFKKLLEEKVASIYFDIDQFFIDENIAAANFINTYKAEWKYYQTNTFKGISTTFKNKKNIHIIGLPKNVSQIKHVGNLLVNKVVNYESTAIILANEALLPITLNTLPKQIKSVNITMGNPLKNIVLANLFTLLFKLHQNKSKIGKQKTYYYKDVIAILNHVSIKNSILATNLIQYISKNNLIFIYSKDLIQIAKKQNNTGKIIKLIFSNWKNATTAIEYILKLIENLKFKNSNTLEIEYLNRFHTIFIQLQNLNSEYNYIHTLDGLFQIYKQILSTETISFKGEALHGLQIMGMLESRVLDFESVIITSVNEGHLPAGNSNNSFIPFDIKREVGLPTYHEKDAIFSYHFYRLLQRAKTVYLLYNTETDDFGSGEQSRFITQLEILQDKLPNHTLTKTIISPKVVTLPSNLQTVIKTEAVITTLNKQAKKGFSPTSLTNYIYNPIAFYKQKILHIKQLQEVEETIAANTLGTIIHRTLEDFYKPYKGKFVEEIQIHEMKKKIAKTVRNHFLKEYNNGEITLGKNLLTFEIAKQFIANFLQQELKLIQSGKKLKIIDIEVDIETTITIQSNHRIKLKGQADRIDELDGVLRIIDYKTGKVKQVDLEIKNWEEITIDYKKSKAFQVLLYAYMYGKMNAISFENREVESGIISFKNLKSGYMKVNKKNISYEDILQFEIELKKLIEEIFNTKIPFVENEKRAY